MKLLLFILLMPLIASAQSPDSLSRLANQSVVDYGDIYTPIQDKVLTNEINSGIYPLPLVIVTIDTLNGISISSYAAEVFNAYNLNNNSLLLLIDTNSKQSFMAVGDNLQGMYTDLEVGRIQREVLVPEFKKGHYFIGTYKTIKELKRLFIFSKKHKEIIDSNNFLEYIAFAFTIIFIISLAIYLIVYKTT
jgi:uncharacterized membrane protein YgcG